MVPAAEVLAGRLKEAGAAVMAGNELRPHPCTQLFPPMNEEAFDALVADMAKNGQRDPIVVDQHDRIVDGVNRFQACLKLEMAPKIERKSLTDGEAHRYSISGNLHRRHLTSSQRAAIAADAATRSQGGHQAAILPDALSQAEAATIMHVSERAVRSASKVKRYSPELHKQVKAGVIPLHIAEQKVVEELERAGGLKKSKKPPRLAAPQDGDETAAIASVYAPLFAELDALPDNLSDHPLFPHHARELITLLTESIKHIERLCKPETSQTRSYTS